MTDHSDKMIELADGRAVPAATVEALHQLEVVWPGATQRQARPAIAAAVIDAYWNVKRVELLQRTENTQGENSND